jgi:hypothetical protein
MTGAGPRVSWAAVDEVCQALERHGFHRAAGPLPDRVITLVQALADTYTALPEQPGPYATPVARATCPECGEAVPRPPDDLVPWQAHGLAAPAWSHTDGSSLCPVVGPDGYRPADPQLPPAGWGGEPPSVRAAYYRQVAAGEPGPPAEGMGVDL